MSATYTLMNLYGGLLCFSMLTYFSKAQIFHMAIENGQLLQYGHAYQLYDRVNVTTMDTHVHILHNGAKTENYLLPYSRKFLRGPIFAVFADDRLTVKIIPAK